MPKLGREKTEFPWRLVFEVHFSLFANYSSRCRRENLWQLHVFQTPFLVHSEHRLPLPYSFPLLGLLKPNISNTNQYSLAQKYLSADVLELGYLECIMLINCVITFCSYSIMNTENTIFKVYHWILPFDSSNGFTCKTSCNPFFNNSDACSICCSCAIRRCLHGTDFGNTSLCEWNI